MMPPKYYLLTLALIFLTQIINASTTHIPDTNKVNLIIAFDNAIYGLKQYRYLDIKELSKDSIVDRRKVYHKSVKHTSRVNTDLHHTVEDILEAAYNDLSYHHRKCIFL